MRGLRIIGRPPCLEQMKTSTSKFIKEETYQLIKEMKDKCFNGNQTHSTFEPGEYNNDASCNRTFDYFSCWDETPGGATAVQHCPEFVTGFDPKRYAYKTCNEDGTWFTMPGENRSWSNYSTCVDMADLKFRKAVNYLYVGGYIVSVLAIFISLAIFGYYRQLQCPRVRIHKNLFWACALNNVLWVLWFLSVVNSVEVIQENTVWCQALHVAAHFFMLASYMWMFNEALHLHLALVVVFVKDELAMRWFNAVGWGLSFLFIVIYASTRFFFGDATNCWLEHDDSVWIFIAPVAITQIISFGFLVKVVIVLLTKLHPTPNQGDMAAVKKAARATGILIPLFGLHFLLIPIRPTKDATGEYTYQVIAALLTSLQGTALAVLYCFTNKEVLTAIRQHLSRYRRNNEAIPMTGLTGVESAQHTKENVMV